MAASSGVVATWLVGEGIIAYRAVTNQKRPPMPGELLATSGLFVALALLSVWQPGLAVTVGVGVDIAAFMNLAASKPWGQALSGPAKSTAAAASTAPAGGFFGAFGGASR